MCEHKIKKLLRKRSKRPVSIYDSDEMEVCSDGYAAFVMEQLELVKQSCADPIMLIEQRVDFSHYVPDGFGTADCLIVSDEALRIIDFKYGRGILVDAEDNSQLKCYALGGLRLFEDLYNFKTVVMTIFSLEEIMSALGASLWLNLRLGQKTS